MDRHLIDFDSPKEKKEQILVPRSATVPSSCVDIVSWSTNDGVNNPFDLVGYQAAANTAAENDPFEMVFNDVLSSQAIRNRQINSVVSKAENVPFRVVNPQSRDAGNTFALLDVNNLSEEETEACNRFADHSCCEYKESKSGLNSSEDEPHSVNIDKFGVKRMNHTEDWSCLDDIQPPDSFLSSSVDMSDLLDDTVSNSILYLTSETESYLFDEFEREEKNNSTSKQSEVSKSTIPDASFSPEEHLRLIAKKKIDNLIDKAECEVKLHIQDSTEKRRSSIKNLTAPFTLRSIGDHLREPVEHSKCFQKWSKDELEKTIKPSVTTSVDTPNDSCSLALGSIHSAFALKSDFKAVEQDTDACNSSLPIFEDMIHTLHTTHLGDRYGSHYMHSVVNERDLLEGRMDNSVSHPSQQMPGVLFHSSSGEATRSGKELCSVSSPVLPVPLCEDAVRNMSLCCKYSPPKVTWQCNNNVPNVLQCKTVTSKQHKASNENKLVLRKPSEPKARQKLAPMKATAPIQNMTRSRSSLTAHLKAEVVTTFPKKSERKEAPSSVSCMGCPRVPGPPSRTMSRSAPNLASPNSKLPTRLPSPRKASGGLSKPRSFARQVDTVDERRVCVTLGMSPSIHYSPRPLLKHFSSKSLSHPRVLSDINASPTAQKPRKCRNTHVEGTKRVSTSKEKENLL